MISENRRVSLLLSDLHSANAELREDVEELQGKNEALGSKVSSLKEHHLDHSGQMSLVELWKSQNHLSGPCCRAIDCGDFSFEKLQSLLRAVVPSTHHSQCDRMRCLEVLSVEQIHNVEIWNNYLHKRTQFRMRFQNEQLNVFTSKIEVADCLPWMDLDQGLNEIIALHGTSETNVRKIVESGFDERLARENGLYGQGVYFSDESCKCLQYSGALNSGAVGCIVVARLLLGDPYLTPGPRKGERIEPYRDEQDPRRGRFNSVIAKPGIVGNDGRQQVHHEFVIHDGCQAYPELIVRFKC